MYNTKQYLIIPSSASIIPMRLNGNICACGAICVRKRHHSSTSDSESRRILGSFRPGLLDQACDKYDQNLETVPMKTFGLPRRHVRRCSAQTGLD
jgi:hypothetical protein